MTFIAQETSQSDGSPQEIYTVAYDFNRWDYTSGDESITIQTQTYRAVPIVRTKLKMSTDKTFVEFKVDFPLDSEFLDLFRISPPSGAVTLLCERLHRTDGLSERAIIFKGRIIDVEWGLEFAHLTCESSSISLKQLGLRKHYQYACPHMLYGPSCNISRDLHKTSGTAITVSGATIVMVAAAGQIDDYYSGGYIEYTHSSLNTIERIAVSGSNGSTGNLDLFSIPVGLSVNSPVDLYAGCDRTFETCKSRFSNGDNYGGMPFIPTKSPFGSDPIY